MYSLGRYELRESSVRTGPARVGCHQRGGSVCEVTRPPRQQTSRANSKQQKLVRALTHAEVEQRGRDEGRKEERGQLLRGAKKDFIGANYTRKTFFGLVVLHT